MSTSALGWSTPELAKFYPSFLEGCLEITRLDLEESRLEAERLLSAIKTIRHALDHVAFSPGLKIARPRLAASRYFQSPKIARPVVGHRALIACALMRQPRCGSTRTPHPKSRQSLRAHLLTGVRLSASR